MNYICEVCHQEKPEDHFDDWDSNTRCDECKQAEYAVDKARREKERQEAWASGDHYFDDLWRDFNHEHCSFCGVDRSTILIDGKVHTMYFKIESVYEDHWTLEKLPCTAKRDK